MSRARVSFIVDTEQALAFVEDAHKTEDVIAYITDRGDDVEMQAEDVKFEVIDG